MKNSSHPWTTSINLIIPRWGYQITEKQFKEYAQTPNKTQVEITVGDPRNSLSWNFTVDSERTVPTKIFWSNKQYKNRVFTLNKKTDKKGVATFWFSPIKPGKSSENYPAFILQEVIVDTIAPAGKVINSVKRVVRNTLMPLWLAAGIALAATNDKFNEIMDNTWKKIIPTANDRVAQPKIAYEIVDLEKGEPIKEEKAETKSESEKSQKIYTVKKWDTLEKISSQHGVTLEKLFELNYFENHIIQPWQEIIIEQWKKTETQTNFLLENNTNPEIFEKNIDTYILKKAPDSPLTWKMVINTSNKHEILPEYILAIMLNDSTLGTKWKWVRTKNPGNVGNDDEWNEREFATWDDWVNAVGKNIKWRVDEFLKCYPDKKPLLSYLVKNSWPDGKGFLPGQKNYKKVNTDSYWAYMTHKPGQEKVVQFALEARERIYSS